MYSYNNIKGEMIKNIDIFYNRYINRKKVISYIEKKTEKLIEEHLITLKQSKNSDLESLNAINSKLKLFDSYDEEINTSSFSKEFKEIAEIPNIIQKNLSILSFTEMTPIQKLSIPIILQKMDLVGCAQTGSGKTLSYLIPIASLLLTQEEINENPFKTRISFPLLLIILPTRELAIQIYNEALKLLYKTGIIPVCVYGGESFNNQIADLREGCDILIGTPGRLIDFLNKKYISLEYCKYLIFDEADRMMDMGFEPDMRSIVDDFNLNDSRQTLMFSATFPKSVLRIIQTFLKKDYFYVTTGNYLGENEIANGNVEQRFFYIKSGNINDKLMTLHKILQIINGKTLVFVNTKRDTSSLKKYLDSKNYNVDDIHGDKKMEERKRVLNDFKKGKLMLLIATDVASRGLDIPEVDYVINFDLPSNIDSYVHRIGRTGRCGKEGKAFSLVMSYDSNLFKDLYNVLIKTNQKIPQFMKQF